MKVEIKKSEMIIHKQGRIKMEYYEIRTDKSILFLSSRIEGNKVIIQ